MFEPISIELIPEKYQYWESVSVVIRVKESLLNPKMERELRDGIGAVIARYNSEIAPAEKYTG